MYRGRKIAVVIPAYEEQGLVGRAVRTVPDFVDSVVVVDDASTDRTAAEANENGDARLVLLRHLSNRGVGAAIVTGYRAALDLGCDVVAVMAGDCQMDPADLPALLDPVARGAADYAKGNRLGHPDLLRSMPAVRVAGNIALTLLTRVASGGYDLMDSQCGYTAVSAAALRELDLGALYPRYGFPNDMLARLAEMGARVVDVPVRPVYGDEKSGIRIPMALITYPRLLAAAWGRRVSARYVAPVASALSSESRLPASRAQSEAVLLEQNR